MAVVESTRIRLKEPIEREPNRTYWGALGFSCAGWASCYPVGTPNETTRKPELNFGLPSSALRTFESSGLALPCHAECVSVYLWNPVSLNSVFRALVDTNQADLTPEYESFSQVLQLLRSHRRSPNLS